MKKTVLSLVTTALLTIAPLAVYATNAPAPTATTEAASTAETYIIDPKHSYAAWEINHLGFSNQIGKWMVEGTLVLDEANPEKSKVAVNIPVANFVTGLNDLNEHLQAELFFDTKKFPNATFVSEKVTKLSDKTAKVDGILTVKGIAKPVSLDVTFNKKGENPINQKETVGFSATTTVKRSDFGMTALLPDLGDEVKISIGVEANK